MVICSLLCWMCVQCGVVWCARCAAWLCGCVMCTLRAVCSVPCVLLLREGAGVWCRCVCVCAEANQAAVAAKGGIEAVVAAMQRHEGVAGVAESGCGALKNIAGLGEFSAAVCARAVGGAGRGSCSAVRQCARRGDVRACVRACVRWCVQCARTWWVGGR